MYVSGYFEIRYIDAVGFGFGKYKMNLLSLIDPGNNNGISWSQILPNIQLSSMEESEGFNYFGMGNLLLILLCFVFLVCLVCLECLVFILLECFLVKGIFIILLFINI